MSDKILIVDDDPPLLQLIEHTLQREGYRTVTASNGTEGLARFYEERPDLIVLDLMMPNLSGWRVCEQVRAESTVPIIILTAKSDPEDVIRGLQMGADDYVKKPFHPAELLARVQAVLRRAHLAKDAPAPRQLVFDGRRLVIDLEKRRVLVDNQEIALTSREYDLLAFLARHAGMILTTEKIFNNVWSYSSDADIDNVKWYIWRLRKKIERDSRQPRIIQTERGIGYRFVAE